MLGQEGRKSWLLIPAALAVGISYLSQLCAMGDMVGSSSWVAPNLFSVVIWECVEIRVSLFSSRKDFLFSTSAGSGGPTVIGARGSSSTWSLATDFLCDAERGT